MKNTKTIFRLYTLFDFEEEQNFLEAQHRAGWKCIKYIAPGFYKFEKCEPANFSYRIDFSDEKYADQNSYRQLFADNGWEFLWQVNGFSIFRKATESDAEKSNTEIFTDTESKIEMLKKILKRRLLPVGIIFLCIIIPNCIKGIRGEMKILSGDLKSSIGSIIFTVLWILILVLYIFIFVHSGIKIKKLKTKYESGEIK